MRIGIVALALAVVAAAVPSTPAAAQSGGTVFRGATEQGGRIAVNVGPDQRVRRVSIQWTATCRKGSLSEDTIIVPRLSTALTFRASGAYTIRQKRGVRIRVSVKVLGQRETAATAGRRWDGTIEGRATVRRRGKVADRCRLRSTVWSATLPVKPPPFTPPPASAPVTSSSPQPHSTSPNLPPPGPRIGAWSFQMTGDQGDYISGGKSWSHGPPETMTGDGGAAGVAFRIEASSGWWDIALSPPQGQQLTPGARFTGARRNAFRDGAAGLEVSGMGRGCNTLTGEFTVHELSYDAAGTMNRFRASFVQHCEGADAAARGTIEFTAA